jgi:hypothetical protein
VIESLFNKIIGRLLILNTTFAFIGNKKGAVKPKNHKIIVDNDFLILFSQSLMLKMIKFNNYAAGILIVISFEVP